MARGNHGIGGSLCMGVKIVTGLVQRVQRSERHAVLFQPIGAPASVRVKHNGIASLQRLDGVQGQLPPRPACANDRDPSHDMPSVRICEDIRLLLYRCGLRSL